jgi:hypothetical protein
MQLSFSEVLQQQFFSPVVATSYSNKPKRNLKKRYTFKKTDTGLDASCFASLLSGDLP